MNDADRGKIRNREYAQQLRDFSGLRFGKITPTDIDGMLEIQDRVFVFIETKHGSAPLPYGQKLALQRLCDACEKSGKPSLVIVASHNTKEDVKVAELPVREIRLKGKWREPNKPLTVRLAIDGFLTWNKITL